MNRLFTMVSTVIVATVCAGTAFAGWPGDSAKCPADSKKVGASCIDKYEASVWQLQAATLNSKAGKSLIAKIQKGKVTLTDLTTAGATPLGCVSGDPSYPGSFPADGKWTAVAGTDPPTPGIYAVSISGVLPSACITWFQAAQACGLSNKRLPSNQQWQIAASGTRDPGSNDGHSNTKCNTLGSFPAVRATGLAGTTFADVNTCVSNYGIEDMVGNLSEWVADWADLSNVGCTDWTSETGIAGGDRSWFGGDGSGVWTRIPGALIRGGDTFSGTNAGVFAVDSSYDPSFWNTNIGFRCAR